MQKIIDGTQKKSAAFGWSTMIKKRKKIKTAVIILIVSAVLIYLMFFAYFPPFRTGDSNTVEISEKTALRECPQIIVTDYDREFLDKILNDPRIMALEDADAKKDIDKHAFLLITADEAGFERYALRPEENYTVHSDNYMFGGSLNISIQFEDKGGLYKKRLYLSADKTDFGTEYTKSVTVIRADGKYINKYWNFHGRYERKTYTYGIVGYIKDIMNAMYGC